MPPVVIDVRNSEDPRDVVHRAVQSLAEGHVVALPTETVYGLAASALDEQAVSRLLGIKGRDAQKAMTLAIKSSDAALDYVPRMPTLGWRMARRCWPGPLTLVLRDDDPDSLVKQLPANVRRTVSPQGTVGLRVPDHPLLLSILRLSPGPLVLTSANRSGESDAVEATQVTDRLGDDVALVLDDGPCRLAQPSSVVQVESNHYQVLRSGALSDDLLRRMSSFLMLVVCTGNTCRSPMAEALANQRLAEKLGCRIDELPDRGVMVMSAGIAAMSGGRASPESVTAMSERGLDLRQHESQPLTDRLVRFADLILTMTHGHRTAIIAQWPEVADRTHPLCAGERDVADPIGGPQELYRRCADQIDGELERWLDTLDLDQLILRPKGSE